MATPSSSASPIPPHHPSLLPFLLLPHSQPHPHSHSRSSSILSTASVSTTFSFSSAPPPNRPAPPPPRPPIPATSIPTSPSPPPSSNSTASSAPRKSGKRVSPPKQTAPSPSHSTLRHSPPHPSHSPPAHSHSQPQPLSNPHPHQPYSKYRPLPQQSSTTSALSLALSTSSLKPSSIFNLKRHRGHRNLLPFLSAGSSSSDSELSAPPQRTKQPQVSRTFGPSSSTSAMQHFEYMADSQQTFSSPLHTQPMPPYAISTAAPSSSQKPPLSAKRMRPPLPDISTSHAATPSTRNPPPSPTVRDVPPPVPSTARRPSLASSVTSSHPIAESSALTDRNTASLQAESVDQLTRPATTRKIRTRAVSRGHLSRDAKALRIRIRRLWQDPRQPEHHHRRHDSKNQYILLEDSLVGILQIVPPIIQNAKSAGVGAVAPDFDLVRSPPTASPSKAPAPSQTLPPTRPTPPQQPPLSSTPSRSSGSPPTTPVHTRARTTSTNSNSTLSATRYQIATSILQPSEPALTDIAQPSIRASTVASLGEPALSTILHVNQDHLKDQSVQDQSLLQQSNDALISKLKSLSQAFKDAIKALLEEQNEKVLRFDDFMILGLLTRWEQEGGKDMANQEPDNKSTTSLVTLGTTDALERYQYTVAKLWQEVESILGCIRMIKELVEFGRVQHYADFDDEDSEEEAIARDEETRRNIYSTLLFHTNSLVTVLGEVLECVSGIQRLVGTFKNQKKAEEGDLNDPMEGTLGGEASYTADFMADEPRPVKHLDPLLMRRLKRKTGLKSIAEKMRRSFSDFAKKSTTSFLSVFPPLGDGSNEGFNWDSYTDDDGEEYVPSEFTESMTGEDDLFFQSLSPPASPGFKSEVYRRRHRRLSSKDSVGAPEQYWPGSTRLGMSDESIVSPKTSNYPISFAGSFQGGHDMAMSRSMSSERTSELTSHRVSMAPSSLPSAAKHSFESLRDSTKAHTQLSPDHDSSVPPLSSLKPNSKEKARQSILFRRRNSVQSPSFTGASISAPIPITSRPFSVYYGTEYTPTRHNYTARPPKPPTTLAPMPPSPPLPPSEPNSNTQDHSSAHFTPRASQRTSSYLATRNTSPSEPLILDSPFSRQTSIRMGHDRNRYSIKMPSDDVPETIVPVPRPLSRTPSAFWRRRSYNDALEKSWQALKHESFVSRASDSSNASALSTPTVTEFARDSSAFSSVRLTSFEFLVPFFSRDGSRSGSRPGSGSMLHSSTVLTDTKGSRRHSSPLMAGAEKTLADALSRRQSISSQKSQGSTSQTSTNPRNSFHMLPTVNEHSKDYHRSTTTSSSSHGSATLLGTDTVAHGPTPHAPEEASQGLDDEKSRSRSSVAPPSKPPTPETPRRPISASRFGDMKKAWEILNLDVRRLNQYSHLRAYAKAYTATQDHEWISRHPNAIQNPQSPKVFHICELGVDVLVVELVAGQLNVVAGTLGKLIERLADENPQDADYVNSFLLSHSFFIDSEDLLERLLARFHIQPRQTEMVYFSKWKTVIQIKILCVINRWIQIQFEDFELNPNLLRTMKKFLEMDARPIFPMEAEFIQRNIAVKSLSPLKNCSVIMEQGRFCLQRSRTRKISLSRSQSRGLPNGAPPLSPGLPPPQLDPIPSTPTHSAPVEQPIEFGPTPELSTTSPILPLNTTELARYLTLADMKAFRSITVFELMTGYWKRRPTVDNKRWAEGVAGQAKSITGLSALEIDSAEDGAIEAFTRRANMLSYWVAHEIVSTAGHKTRKQLIKKFIEVAKICLSLNNLHTAMFVTSALVSTPVRRLTSTWKLVSSRDMETLRGLELLLDPSGNMRHYRRAASEVEAPTIPFLPILLKDITFILDGNPTMVMSRAGSPPKSASRGFGSFENPGASEDSETPTETGTQLLNFDKFRRLTQYVENAIDMAKSADYSFEHQLLRQARVFRPSSPSLHGSKDMESPTRPSSAGRLSSSQADPSVARGALDHISELVERRLVKASGLYGVHQRVIEVEFSTKAKTPQSMWKGGSIHGSAHGPQSGAESVIRSVQGEEEYLMGLSLMCEPGR